MEGRHWLALAAPLLICRSEVQDSSEQVSGPWERVVSSYQVGEIVGTVGCGAPYRALSTTHGREQWPELPPDEGGGRVNVISWSSRAQRRAMLSTEWREESLCAAQGSSYPERNMTAKNRKPLMIVVAICWRSEPLLMAAISMPLGLHGQCFALQRGLDEFCRPGICLRVFPNFRADY